MTNRPMPLGADLEAYKNEAKTLLKSVRDGDADALKRVKPFFEDFTSAKLTQMQLVVAREYGFASWAKLRSQLKILKEFVAAQEELTAAKDALTRITRRMSGKEPLSSKDGVVLSCSFCGITQNEARKLIAGPSVYVCDECVELCNQIIHEELQE